MTSIRLMARHAAESGVNGVAKVLGRRRAVRTARFATNVLRFDDQNQMETNGETLIQRVARSRPDAVVFDVGANMGQWSRSLLMQPGHPVNLHLFEPSSYSHGRAVEALGDQASVWALAMSSVSGRQDLLIVKEGAGVNSLVPFEGERTASATESVEVQTVDEFCSSYGIQTITLLKIDAEGLDLEVIRGAREMIARSQIGIIQFEYNWRWVFSRSFLRDVFDFFEDCGSYSLGKVTPKGIEFYDGWHHELETFREANYVIVREDWRNSFPQIPWWGG